MMLNKMKARILIGFGGLAVTSFVVMMGYAIGSHSVTSHTQKQIQTEAHKLLTKEKEKEKASVLSDELVKEFLTQYYTKEKLGENNNRIKPYMTDSAYKEEVARQEESINQVYKDYMLDYRFESANIYVNTEENEAFAEVSYQVDYVSEVSDKAHLPSRMVMTFRELKSCALKLIFPFLKVYSSQEMTSGSMFQSVSNLNLLSFLKTDDVEIDSLCRICFIAWFSMSKWTIFWLTATEIWLFFLTRGVSATAIFPQSLHLKRRFLSRISKR